MNIVASLEQLEVTLEIRPISTQSRMSIYESPVDARQLANLSLADGDWLHQIYHAKILHRLVTDPSSRRQVALAMIRDAVSGTGAYLASALDAIGREAGATMSGFELLREWWRGQPEPLEAGIEEHIRLINVD